MKERDIARFLMPNGKHQWQEGRGDWSVAKIRSTEDDRVFRFKVIEFRVFEGGFLENREYRRLVPIGWGNSDLRTQAKPRLEDVYVDISRCEELDIQRPFIRLEN